MQDLITFLSNHPALSLSGLFLIVLVIIVERMRAGTNKFALLPQQATQMINHQHAVVIDIRPADAFQKGHIIDSLSVPSRDLQASARKKIEKFKNKPLIFVCGTGYESKKIAATFIKQGYNAYSLSGGLRAWIEAQMPVVKK